MYSNIKITYSAAAASHSTCCLPVCCFLIFSCFLCRMLTETSQKVVPMDLKAIIFKPSQLQKDQTMVISTGRCPSLGFQKLANHKIVFVKEEGSNGMSFINEGA